MANSFTREFETLETLIEAQVRNSEDAKWPAVALLAILDTLNEYWEIVENETVDDDLQGRTIDVIYELIHSVIVHQELPLTEAEAIALEDQQVAEFRNDLEGLGEKLGIDLHILNLDQKLKEAFGEKPEDNEKEEE